MPSLRQKLTTGYLVIAILVVGLALLSYVELRQMEARIEAGKVVDDFFDIALEIRRFEKNYFLYRQKGDLEENRAYVERGWRLLQSRAGLFAALAEPARIARLDSDLSRYTALIDAALQGTIELRPDDDIRLLGKNILEIAESLANRERQILQAQLDRHQNFLLAAVSLVGLLVIGIGQWMSRRVGKPLKALEERMEAIAAGRVTSLDLRSEDREIASLTQAFNHVLRELEARRDQLARTEKLAALGTLLSGVAHELNNPLSNIGTSTQILAEEVGAGGTSLQRELIDQIDAETWRARHIVRSLLDHACQREIRLESIHLLELVNETLRFMRGYIPDSASVTVDIPAELVVTGDRQRLRQVFINLLGNAFAAIGSTGRIDLHACPLDPDADRRQWLGSAPGPTSGVEITVRDNGHGIAPEVLSRIFDPFYTTKAVGQGVGLGLFVVFEIVEEHRGCIRVDSMPDVGTSFHIRLPGGIS